jgi:hypothetical protein
MKKNAQNYGIHIARTHISYIYNINNNNDNNNGNNNSDNNG